MMHRIWLGAVVAIGVSTALHAGADDKKLVYADFEKVDGGRPVSARGGMVLLYQYEEDHAHASTFKGAEGLNPPGPELVRVKADDPNHAAKFDYSLQAPNQWAGVAIEIHGLPDADGKAQTDDVSGYKYLSLQLYATGIRIMKLETRANESGKDTLTQWPMFTIEVKPGLNTYRVPLSGFIQPSWVRDVRIDPKKDVFTKLTSIAITAFCDQCDQPRQGMVIVDNIFFEK
jgi:hypothetical protein